jgi:hypothetical protein
MSLVTVPVDTDIKDIMNIIRRDGGIIVKDFVTPAQVAEFNAESAPVFERLKVNPDPSNLGELSKEFYASASQSLLRWRRIIQTTNLLCYRTPLTSEACSVSFPRPPRPLCSFPFGVRSWMAASRKPFNLFAYASGTDS